MADWAGAYGAGGAAGALEQIVARQFLERKQAEIERAQRVQEQAEQQRMAQQAEQFRQSQGLQYANLAATQDDRYQDRTQHVADVNRQMQRQTLEDQMKAGEKAGDVAREDARTKADQQWRTDERKGRESFEALMARRTSGAGASEPLVAIKDPVTGQPTLVPRSQAAGKTPASTRDQAMTEGQSNAATFADRMKFNESHIQKFESVAVNPAMRAAGWVPNEFLPKELQSYEAAKRNWMAADLRKQSGATITPSEYDEENKQYFPQPGDSQIVIEQKRQLRAIAEAGMRRAAGSGAAAAPAANTAPQGNDLGAEW